VQESTVNIADAKNEIKKEFSNDEKVLESAFKLETFYKKNKVIIWAVVIGLLLFFIAKTTMESMKAATLAEANQAFLTLQSTPEDKAALATLKEKNPGLYDLYTYSVAVKNSDTKSLGALTTSSNEVVSDMSTYSVAALENKSSDSKLYREMALIQEAYLLIKAGDVKGAKAKLTLIEEGSPLAMLASLLKHSTLKAK
jgi:putative exporter of polyketide antibiotics